MIFRGSGTTSVNTVYLVYFARAIFEGGGVQYQQLAPSNQWPGYFDFYCKLPAFSTPPPPPPPRRRRRRRRLRLCRRRHRRLAAALLTRSAVVQ